jgi:hypothetical protein
MDSHRRCTHLLLYRYPDLSVHRALRLSSWKVDEEQHGVTGASALEETQPYDNYRHGARKALGGPSEAEQPLRSLIFGADASLTWTVGSATWRFPTGDVLWRNTYLVRGGIWLPPSRYLLGS